MTQNTKKQFGIILAALASIGAELAGENLTNSNPVSEPQPSTPAPEPAPTKRRGRPPVTTPAETPAEETAAPAEPAPTTGTKTYEELRELIKPLVEEGRGEEVKKVIGKYAASLKEIPADKQAAFVKDIEGLTY